MPSYTAGLDLGQASDYTALVVAEHLLLAKETPEQIKRYERVDVVHVERFQLGTPYPAIVESVTRLLRVPPLRGNTRLLIDATGVGRPIVDLFRDAHREGVLDRWPYPITITAGEHQGRNSVPKRDLVSSLQALVQTQRLRFASGLPLLDVLRKELLAFSAKVSKSGADRYEAMRESDHDDLVIALAFAAWHSNSNKREERRFVSRTGQVFEFPHLANDPYEPVETLLGGVR